jgi:UrcA family protein
MFTGISKGRGGYKAGIVAGLMGFMVLAAAQAPAATFDTEVVVKYGDLDINSAAGAEKLYERLRQAAAQVCPQVSSLDLPSHQAGLRCLDAVVAHAVSSVGSAQLAAVYASRTHHSAHSPA